MKYTAGFNMPGYLPETDPQEFMTFDEAKQYIINEVLWDADNVATEELAEELTHFAEEINLENNTFSYYCGNLVYWVQPT